MRSSYQGRSSGGRCPPGGRRRWCEVMWPRPVPRCSLRSATASEIYTLCVIIVRCVCGVIKSVSVTACDTD